jgi:hypothetical protein
VDFEIITHGLIKHMCLYTWTFKGGLLRDSICVVKIIKDLKVKVLWNKSLKSFSNGLLNGQN